ncbi:uncharacterized protein EV422DRAFT_499356, partial [Fimicolochytrium jonesii]|uniref:uncharacterized protein n=1 Tax=Fimicolochytrium jonesii TaxID=1396493 RepID=UPI0022FECAC3
MDSETFVTIGTPQPEDAKDVGAKDRNKVLPIHLQEPRDEQGRKRFHGAFTGGFSAGYFNTVGSKEGWTPSQFVSSRSSRPEARNASQRPEDFMDEEDMASLTANQQIAATEEFDILGGTARELARRKATVNAVERDGSAAPMALPAALVEDLIGPSKDPIGKKLLRQMGWREGHGVGPRARRRRRGDGKEDIYATEHLFAPKDVTVDTLKPKADHYGIGFDPYENAPEFAHLKKSAATKPSSEAKPAKRSGFGVGVFEDETEDLDVYGSSGMATYDMIIDDDEDERVFMRQKFGAARTSDGGSGDAPSRKTTGLNTEFLDIYSGLCNDGRPPLEGYAPPDVPADFVPLHKFPPPSATQPAAPTSTTEWQGRQQSQTHSALSADARRDLLGEEALKAPQRSVFAYLPLKEQDRLQEYINKANRGREELAKRETAQNAPAPNEPKLDKQTAEAALKGFMPFGNDPPKQGRYRRFLEVAAGMATEYATVPKVTQDISHERLEFSKAAQIFKPLSSMMASRFTSATHTIEPGFAPSSKNLTTPQPNDTHLQKEAADLNMYGRLTRSVKEWRPEKLLCKRFGVPDPYMNAKKKEKVEDEKNEVARDRLVARGGLGMGMDPGRAALIGAASDGSSEKVSATPETEAKETSASAGEDEYERPPMDIFKAIFADSDDEVEEESDEER